MIWMKTNKVFLLFILFLLITSQHSAFPQVPGVEHVVIIGCDGMSPDGVRKANTPYMDWMMKNGAYTLHARAVMPTSSSPNWASMIMGAGPEQHGVTSNDWQPDKFDITPTCVGSCGIFPTIFGVLRQQRPKSILACFHDWSGFGRLFERKAVNKIDDAKGPDKTVEHAVAYLKEKKPMFTFIHLDHVDHAGHKYGHGTHKYYQAVEKADQLIGDAIQGLQDAGIFSKTIVLVTADHGGRGKGHGGATMAEIEIPWILLGPGVTRGKEILKPVNTFDTAATIAYIFGLKMPKCWIAQPVREAFLK